MRFAVLLQFGFATQWQFTSAYQQYRSRSDLSPPKLNITIPATGDVAEGYIFVAPYSSGSVRPEQPAAYIFRNDGDLVWSSLGHLSGFVGNFHVTQWKGNDILQAFQGTLDIAHGHGVGHFTLLDGHYDHLIDVWGGDHKSLDLHEFTIVDEKTALVDMYDPVSTDLTRFGGNQTQKWIIAPTVQELDIDTGEVLFEWHSLDHVDPSNSVVPLGGTGSNSAEAWDYMHLNSVDKDAQGNYLISGCYVNALYKLDGKTGDIIWQLGGKKSNFSVTEDAAFAFQHDARFRGRNREIEYISLFDNSAKGWTRDYSSGKLLKLDTSSWTASLVKEVVHPDKVGNISQGNTQILPNGNFFVNWGQAGTITEFRANDSKPIFNAYLDTPGTGVQNYRGFRSNWTGEPPERPAMATLNTNNTIQVYVSWNGDTKTAAWRFYAVRGGSQQLLGETKRLSFETSSEFDMKEHGLGVKAQIFAEAIDSTGKPFARTDNSRLSLSIAPGIQSCPLLIQLSIGLMGGLLIHSR